MEENKSITLRTYAKTWEFDYIIYGYGDLTLPFPLRLSQVGFFAVAILLVNILIIPIPGNVSWLLRIAAAVALTHFGTNLDIDGKKPYIWIPKQIMYLVMQPKRWCKFRPVKEENSFTFNRGREVVVR